MAWRDGKASSSRLLLFMASIILGIAAVVSIQLFSENLKQNIQRQSKSLMGADFIIDSRQLPNDKVQAIIDSLGADASEVNFSSMAAFPKNGETKLVRVRGIQGGFPFYGTIDTDPLSAASTYQESGGALVDATMMLQYELNPGDSINLFPELRPFLVLCHQWCLYHFVLLQKPNCYNSEAVKNISIFLWLHLLWTWSY